MGLWEKIKGKKTNTTDYREAEWKMAREEAYHKQRLEEERKKGREQAKGGNGGFMGSIGSLASSAAKNIDFGSGGGGRRGRGGGYGGFSMGAGPALYSGGGYGGQLYGVSDRRSPRRRHKPKPRRHASARRSSPRVIILQ